MNQKPTAPGDFINSVAPVVIRPVRVANHDPDFGQRFVKLHPSNVSMFDVSATIGFAQPANQLPTLFV